MSRQRRKTQLEEFMNLDALKNFVLTHIGAFALGAVTALLPRDADPALVELTKRGVEVLIDLLDGDGRTFPMKVHVLFRGDSMGPSAGEIMASIERGLKENPFQPAKGLQLSVKHLLNAHACIRPACIDGEPRNDGLPTLDLHTAAFELAVDFPEAKKA